MPQNRTRSSSGTSGSSASSRTRWLKSSQESSRLKKRAGSSMAPSYCGACGGLRGKSVNRPLGGDALRGVAVGAAVEEVEDDSLPQAPLADLQRLPEQVGDLLEQEDSRRQDADPGRVELEAAADLDRRVAGEDADAALQCLVLEHGADQPPQPGGG